MKFSPEDLEQFIHRALRELPEHPAPRTLELRVLAEIERRRALPWWRQSYAHWPVAVRGAFLVLSAVAAAVLVAGLVLLARRPEATAVAGALSDRSAAMLVLRSLAQAGSQAIYGVIHAIPSLWLYGALAFLAVCYATVIGVGAAAYRALLSSRA